MMTTAKTTAEIKLTEEQNLAIKKTIKNLETKKLALLSGISGTGKSTSTSEIVKHSLNKNKKVHLTATTHKALEVVEKMSSKNVTFSTIHSFLNLVPDKHSFNGGMVLNTKADMKYADLLIIDEYSMLTGDVIYYLMVWINRNPRSQVLLVGDSSQLILDNKALEKLKLNDVTTYLTTSMRQGALSDIAIYSKMASAFILKRGVEPSIPWGEEVVKYTSHEEFIKAWKRTKADSKTIIAFKNITVKAYNTNINKHYRHQKDEYVVGNKIVLRKAVFNSAGQMIPSRRTVTIQQIIDMEAMNRKDRYYQIKCEDGWFNINKTATWLNELTQKLADEKKWTEYYSIREKYTMVHHAEAITVHGSQGSSYDEVFIDATDIQTAREHVLRMAYVSISRAKTKVHIYVGSSTDRNYKKFKPEVEDSL